MLEKRPELLVRLQKCIIAQPRSLNEIRKAMGISYNTLKAYLMGKRYPHLKQILKIERYVIEWEAELKQNG